MSVLVAGDANVDLELRLPAPGIEGSPAHPAPRLFGGGSAANTAAGLAGLGIDTTFVGAVGDDVYGRFARADLAAAGVDTAGMATTGAEPTVTVIAVVQPDGDRLIYVWPPSGGAHGELEPADTVDRVIGKRWLHVSGIALRVSPAREALLLAMAAAGELGIPVSLDLNLRLENWGWEDGFRDVVEAAVDLSDVVMGAAGDEVTALAGSTDPAEAASRLARGRRVVIARLGSHGALAAAPTGVVTVPGFEVPVRDTLGAGDAFNAGFIGARLEDAGLEESLRWGNAVAALTITRPGARSTPTRGEVEALLAK